ncbi:MAG: hypothetical protein J6C23_00560 [Clostridia bacterium]|nr:hypothetical protein [Clostridia bacterium]
MEVNEKIIWHLVTPVNVWDNNIPLVFCAYVFSGKCALFSGETDEPKFPYRVVSIAVAYGYLQKLPYINFSIKDKKAKFKYTQKTTVIQLENLKDDNV